MFQEHVLGQRFENIVINDPLENGVEIEGLTHVIFAPPFGGKMPDLPYLYELAEYGIRNIEDLYLEKAIKLLDRDNGRIVALVPEGLLFAGGRREYTRKYLMRKMRITAIIGLDAGALSPYSQVKTSILVLDKKPIKESEVFMAQITLPSQEDTFSVSDIPQISEILQAFGTWTRGGILVPSENIWTKDFNELKSENFSINYYRPNDNDLVSPPNIETVPIRELVTFIGRGKAIKLDDHGKIPVIGPAAIRTLTIEKDGIQKTSKEKLPENPQLVQAGDILINNIGAYLGQAAIADKSLDGINISQHVVVVRVDPELIDREYFAIILNSDYVRNQFKLKSTGTIMPSLTRTSIDSILIPLPPLSIQKNIVRKILATKVELDLKNKEMSKLKNELDRLLEKPFQEEGNR